MKKILKALSIFLVINIMFSYFPSLGNRGPAFAAEVEKKYNVPSNKEWTIKFNMEIDKSTVNTSNIKVYEKNSTYSIPINITLSSNLKEVKVKPTKPYTHNKIYVLELNDKIKSKDGKFNLSPYKLEFNAVDNVFAGLPSEDGLIIVEDTAYSVKYLEKNNYATNEIIKNGNYDFYYLYDAGYQRISKLFSSDYDSHTGNNSVRKYNKMTYIDENGKKHIYEWDNKTYEFKEVLPKLDVYITVKSPIKAISFKINKIYGLPDAKYYKLKHSNFQKSLSDTATYTSDDYWDEVYILSGDGRTIAKGVFETNWSGSKSIYLNLDDESSFGTTTGNSNNNGIASVDNEGYIYYSNPADNEKLYKAGYDGAYNKKISEDKAQYINVSNGWIYYSNYSDGGKIYKVRTDGSGREKIADVHGSYLTLCGDNIYFCNHSDGGKIYKVSRYGSGLSKLPADTGEAAYLNIVGDYIYYTNLSDGHKPYVVSLDGKFRGKIWDGWADCLQVVGNYMYFSSGTGVISKIAKDGNGPVIPILAEAKLYNKGHHINVFGDYIYYGNVLDKGKLYKIKTDGSGEKIKLSDEDTGYINVLNGKLIFNTTKNKIFSLSSDSDGSEKPVELGTTKSTDKIKDVEDITIDIPNYDANTSKEYLEKKYLPDRVSAIFQDNTMHQIVVSWDKEKATLKNGVYTYKGNLVGYNKTINLYMNILSEMLNDTNKITINNNPGKYDTIEVIDTGSGTGISLNQGDVISVYNDEDCKKLLGKATVGKDRKALVRGIDLDSAGRSFYITVKRGQKGESKATIIKQPDAPTVNPKDAADNDSVGFELDGRDFTLNKWIRPRFTGDSNISLGKQYIYILPSRTQLDMMNQTAFDEISLSSSGPWRGTKDKIKDSKQNLFKNGSYDIYVSVGFSGYGSTDVQGRKPQISGQISSESPANLTVVSEVLPNPINIASMKVQPGTPITLPVAPKPGETVWIAPAGLKWTAETDGSIESVFKESNKVAKLVGDGTSKIIHAPLTPNPYKVYVTNSVGSSKESSGSIIVEGDCPSITTSPANIEYIFVGNTLKVSSSKRGKVYLMSQDNYKAQTVADLDQAVKDKQANFVNIYSNKIYYPLSSAGLDYYTINNNFILVAADEAGNISEPVNISIIRDTSELEFYIFKAQCVVDELIKIDPDKALNLKLAINSAEDLMKNNTKATTYQIDKAAKNLDYATVKYGGTLAANQWQDVYNARESIKEKITGDDLTNGVGGYIISSKNNTTEIELPQLTDDFTSNNITIKWESDNDLIKIDDTGTSIKGIVTIPEDIDQHVTLTATITKLNDYGAPIASIKRYEIITVKAKRNQ